jgi:CRISPR-associated protein Csb2
MPPAVRAALGWLELQRPPLIIAPPTEAPSGGYALAVPNNAGDLVAKGWLRDKHAPYAQGDDANPAIHRKVKGVRPTRFRDGDEVHFGYVLPDSATRDEMAHVEILAGLSRSVVALGWGIDLVVGRGRVADDAMLEQLPGERWLPTLKGARDLRVPVAGTLDALDERHRAFLVRIQDRVWRAPPPVTRFAVAGYGRPADPQSRDYAAFAIRVRDRSGRFQPFDTKREGIVVAARVRHATALAATARGWDAAETRAKVLGHGPEEGAPVGSDRLAYLPVASVHVLGGRGERVGDVRRVLVTSYSPNLDGEIAWASSALAGAELVDEETGRPAALLDPLDEGDAVLKRYVRASASWATVTPVVLPGFDDPGRYRRRLRAQVPASEQRRLLDKLAERREGLVRNAIEQAGFPRELAKFAQIEVRSVGFFAGTDLASRYRVPRHLERFPRAHVRLMWRDPSGLPLPLPGPICLGGGRFCGLGVFASIREGEG